MQKGKHEIELNLADPAMTVQRLHDSLKFVPISPSIIHTKTAQ